VSRFSCRCGREITNTTCPSTHEARLVTDIEEDDAICSGKQIDPLESRGVMECPDCLRIWIEVHPRANHYIPYKPEEEPLGLAERQGGYRG
jgi:hypothetical protein